MSATSWIMFDKALLYGMDGTIDYSAAGAGAFKCCLLDSGWTPATSADTYTAISGDEIAGAFGYTTTGEALTGISLTEASGVVTFTSDPISLTASGGSITARYAVIYDTASDKLVCYCEPESGADKTATDGNDFVIQPHASGILTVARA